MKVSILFKPSRQSWINSDLTYLWYYEYSYNDFYNIPIKNLLKKYKIKIDWVPFDKIDELYEYCKKKFNNQKCTIIIMCSITNLFEN
jgi:tricorn protease-like protein